MSGCDIEEQVNLPEDPIEPEKAEEPQVSDDEDDYEGYFLEPVGGNINIAEKIAEANKKLFEEKEDDEGRPRRVQFNDEVINFEPIDYSDEDITESARNSIISEEDLELKLNEEVEEDEGEDEIKEETNTKIENTPETEQNDLEDSENLPVSKATDNENLKFESDVEIDEIVEELENDEVHNEEEPRDNSPSPRNKKLLFVLLPKDQNSSCESIIGEEIIVENNYKEEEKEATLEAEKVPKTKIARPKSAYNSKLKKSCEMSKISPNLNYSSILERTSWQGSRNISAKPKTNMEKKEKKSFDEEIKVKITGKFLKKINIDDLNLEDIRTVGDFSLKKCSENRPKSSCNDWRGITPGGMRPKTAPLKRTCCVIKTELPNYNGLRSEYGLSAEQLEERRQKTLEIKHQKKQNRLKERQEEMRKRNENEEAFQKWLYNKRKNSINKKPIKVIDMLARSDVYIQTHASYATNRNVPYSVDYTLNKKFNNKKRETAVKKTNKTINVAKYLDKVSPHFKRSFNIYLGLTPA